MAKKSVKCARSPYFIYFFTGFVFSEHEKTALVQYEGGPCAVIAPVQGFIIKNAIFGDTAREDLSTITGDYYL